MKLFDKMEVETLLPKKLDKGDASYKAVEELDEILKVAEKKDIRNIALTGPYGSKVLYSWL